MCTHGSQPERLCLVAEARETADQILERYLRVPIAKAMDLTSTRGFDRAVARLAAQLRAQAKEPEDSAVRAVVAVLDVDWGSTSAEQRRTLVARALDAAGRKATAIPGAVQATFGDAADEVVRAARSGARQTQRLTIGADFNALDRRIVDYISTSQSLFIRDEYGRRASAFSLEARRVVADGLEAGLGRHDIARDLARAAASTLGGRGQPYWEVVAGAFVGQGRSFGQLSSYAEAGIDRYVFEAVLDEHTTETCRFLHGKTFSVNRGLRLFDRLEANPGAVKEILPWVRESLDPDSGRKSLYVNQSGRRTVIAEVTRSAVGTKDDRGEFARGLSERDLSDLGISLPPLHGLCRSTVVAVV